MSTTVTRVSTKASAFTRSVTFIADRLLETILRIAQLHGINDPSWIDRLDVTVRGLRVWLVLRQLNAVVMEVFNGHELVAKYEFPTVPKTGGDPVEYFEDRVAEIEALVNSHGTPAPATYFRIVCDCDPGWQSVPGWSPSAFSDDRHLQRTRLADNLIGTSSTRVEAYMSVKGEIRNDRHVHQKV